MNYQRILDKGVPKNTIILPSAGNGTCVCDIWIDVVSLLHEKISIIPKYFFYLDEGKLKTKKSDFLKQCGEDVFFHNHLNAWNGLGYPEVKKRNFLDEPQLKNIAHYELIGLKMMDRIDPLGDSFPFLHRQFFFRELVLRWLDIIDDMDINLVISPEVPHRVYDYALYVAMKIKKVPLLTFEVVSIFGSDASFIIDDIDSLPIFHKEYINSLKTSGFNKDIKKKVLSISDVKGSYNLWYMDKLQENRAATKSGLMLLKMSKKIYKDFIFRPIKTYQYIFGRQHWSYNVKKGLMPRDSFYTYSLYELLKLNWFREKRINELNSLYMNMVSDFDKKVNYIFVALHYQPELTTSPTAGVFVDQLLIIDMLDRFLPQNIIIYVKEHSAQFNKLTESSSGRTTEFYFKLAEFSQRVKILDVSHDSLKLIDSALAVVTVSGTVGFESIMKGTPALIFGRAWYEGLPGVLKIKSTNDLKKCWAKLEKAEFKVESKLAEDYLHKLSQLFIYGLANGSVIEISNRPHKESVDNIVEGILSYLRLSLKYE